MTKRYLSDCKIRNRENTADRKRIFIEKDNSCIIIIERNEKRILMAEMK